jgi:hypothetical protein
MGACGSGDTSSGPVGGVAGFSAKIDGTVWTPTVAVTAINAAPGFYSITATRVGGTNGYTMVLSLQNIRGPGTYPLGVLPSVLGGTAQLSIPPSGGWSTALNGVAGEVVITTLTATRLVGTFRFDAVALSGSTGTRTVTEGAMDIAVNGSAGVASASQGSRFSGTVGSAFAAAGVSTIASGQTVTIVATDNTRNLTMSLSGVSGAGTYALSAAAPVRTVQVSGTTGNALATWGSQIPGGSGSVEITSFTATRIAGTFTGTLAALSGGATGTLSLNGSFDVAR